MSPPTNIRGEPIPIPEDTSSFEEIVKLSFEQLVINARTTLKDGKLHTHSMESIFSEVQKLLDNYKTLGGV